MVHEGRDLGEQGGLASAIDAGLLIGRRCERAVVTAYAELRDRGSADPEAFRACTTLYRIHHPEASIAEARDLVAEWIEHHIVRHDAGPTHGCECE